jgi:hypothetical protein
VVPMEQLAEAALAGDALRLRSLTQDFLSQTARLADTPRPLSSDPLLCVIAAGLIELLAERRHEPAPTWAAQIGATHPPLYLVKSAHHMPRLRRLCESESPAPLRHRNLFAPPTFLEFV